MLIRFNIAITLYTVPGQAGPDVGVVQREVETALATFWPALGLPAEPVISVASSAEPFELFEFLLELDGGQVPVPVCKPGLSEGSLSFRIMSALFANRARLVNAEQLRELRRRCLVEKKLPPVCSTAPLEVWQSIAGLLLENGFSLARLAACFKFWKPGVQPESAFERMIESLENLRVRLVVSPALAAGSSESDPGMEARLPDFYQEMYEELGVILPKFALDTDKALSAETFQLQFNDIWLPDPTGPDTSSRAQIVHWIKYCVRQCAAWFINTELVNAQLDLLEEENRSLIVMIREQWPAYRLCTILRQLLNEQISIRNLAEVLDVLLRIDGPLPIDDTEFIPYFPPVSRVVIVPPGAPSAEFTDTQLVGQVRANLKFQVVFPHMRGGVLPCYTFAPDLLRDFREGFFRESTPRPGNALYRLLQLVYQQTAVDFPAPVFLTPGGIRPEIQAVLRPYFPDLAVIGHEEVPPYFVPSVSANLTLP